MGHHHLSCTIYVGNLPLDVKDWEIEDLFHKYGRIVDIEMKLPPRPPGFCFVEFDDPRAAQDAIRGRDGYNFDGCLLRVELSHGGRARSPVGRRSGDGGGRYGVSHRTEYRVIVRGLPTSASWQDLKDHMRKAGDVCFAQVFRDAHGTTGIVDYTNYEDMQYAIRKLDDTEFQGSYIRVKAHEGRPLRNRSRSRSPMRGRSRSPITPMRGRSRSLEKRSRNELQPRSASPTRPSRQ